MVVAWCRAILAVGATAALAVGRGDLTWPYVTVSDVLASSGGPVLYASWVVAFGTYFRARGILNVFAAVSCVALLAPAFAVPYGTPIRIEHAALAPCAYAAHALWALSFVAVTASIAEARAIVLALAATTGTLYLGGQLADAPHAVALGCLAEWTLLYAAVMYA